MTLTAAAPSIRSLHIYDPDQLVAPICMECGKLMPCPTLQLMPPAPPGPPAWWVCHDLWVLTQIGATWGRYAKFKDDRLTALAIDLGNKVVGLEKSPEGHFIRLKANPSRVYLYTSPRPGPNWTREREPA